MQYEQGERDMVMLQHKFEIENKDGSKVSFSASRLAFNRGLALKFYPLSSPLVGDPHLDSSRLRSSRRIRRWSFLHGQARWSSLRSFGSAHPRRRHHQEGVSFPEFPIRHLAITDLSMLSSVLAPYSMDIVQPIMDACKAEGIELVEKVL